jgi:hypothetical protein
MNFSRGSLTSSISQGRFPQGASGLTEVFDRLLEDITKLLFFHVYIR